MAALDFDDGDKKSRDILDLSAVTIRSESELKKWLEKVPDFKIRPEKVRAEDVRLGEDGLNSSGGSPVRHDPKTFNSNNTYPFCDACPPSMKDVCIKELGRVNINWRMLTVARPKTKLEEDIFSRLVQLEKLQHKTVMWENEQEAIKDQKGSSGGYNYRGGGPRSRVRAQGGRGPSTKAAVTERRIQTCRECGEEFCLGTCKKYLYDDHARTLNPVSEDIFKITGRLSRKAKKSGSVKKSTGAAAENDAEGENGLADEESAAVAEEKPEDFVGCPAASTPLVEGPTISSPMEGAENVGKVDQINSSLKSKDKGAKPKLHRVGKKTHKSKKR